METLRWWYAESAGVLVGGGEHVDFGAIVLYNPTDVVPRRDMEVAELEKCMPDWEMVRLPYDAVDELRVNETVAWQQPANATLDEMVDAAAQNPYRGKGEVAIAFHEGVGIGRMDRYRHDAKVAGVRLSRKRTAYVLYEKGKATRVVLYGRGREEEHYYLEDGQVTRKIKNPSQGCRSYSHLLSHAWHTLQEKDPRAFPIFKILGSSQPYVQQELSNRGMRARHVHLDVQ